MSDGKTLMALATGLMAGAVLGILFAPEKGSEIRKRLTGSARDMAFSGKDLMINWKDKLAYDHHHNGNGHHQKSKGRQVK